MTIFIPLGTGAKERDNWELRYMLRGLQANYISEVDIHIYGDPDCRPAWLQNVTYKEFERYYPDGLEEKYGIRKYENFFAVLAKLEAFVKSDECPQRFVYMYDDQLLVKPISSFDHLEKVVVGMFKDRKSHGIKHEETVRRAIDIAHKDKHHNGLWSCETHLPRVFDKDRLCRLFRKFPLSKEVIPYSVFTLYYNLYYSEPDVVLTKKNKLKASIHWDAIDPHGLTPLKMSELDDASKEYEWFQYQDVGLFAVDHLLKKWIESKFNVKSKYEV